VLETYAYKKKYMGYGFGGIPNFMNITDEKHLNELVHCFPINGNIEDPGITGLKNLLKKYREALKGIELFGPTFFEKVHS